ncbi:MAG: AhpC/TSA family protein [Fimbriimonadaceae bacterium]|nr:AhpC/TSA family protein [Fimbriimonadaceae bacterium]QYK58485.1 MAG: AhpC/TSA family protein [Fimbriimonadaceae bacterium]
MVLPTSEVQLDNGENVPLPSLWAERAVALVFLRHFGCVFCRRYVAQLRPLADENIVFVGMAGVEETDRFRRRMRSPHRFVCDPEAKLYEAFGLCRGSVGQMLNLRTLTQGAVATLQGHGFAPPTSDPWRMPGVFVVATSGEIVWSYRSRDASDNPPASSVLAALKQA